MVCGCYLEAGVETKYSGGQVYYDTEDFQYVSYAGFVERCAGCKEKLGEGYGDANYFNTKEEAEADLKNTEETYKDWVKD